MASPAQKASPESPSSNLQRSLQLDLSRPQQQEMIDTDTVVPGPLLRNDAGPMHCTDGAVGDILLRLLNKAAPRSRDLPPPLFFSLFFFQSPVHPLDLLPSLFESVDVPLFTTLTSRQQPTVSSKKESGVRMLIIFSGPSRVAHRKEYETPVPFPLRPARREREREPGAFHERARQPNIFPFPHTYR